ncbi:MAG: His-Xaa-Ser system protein HxsD [Gammaproteobacteria bacterium]
MGEVTLKFDAALYSLQILKKAAYKFSDVAAVTFSQENGSFYCHFSFSDTAQHGHPEVLLAEYKKEVLDQDLRETIRAETEVNRNLILAHAFSKADVEGDE